MTTTRVAARRDDAGSVAVELALGVGVLVLPVAVLVLLLPTWIERQSMARTAAHEAARAMALADDPVTGRAAAEEVATTIAANHGVADDLAAVTVSGDLRRGSTVTATVTVRIPLVAIPFVGDVGGFTISATHREPVDRYRSFPTTARGG